MIDPATAEGRNVVAMIFQDDIYKRKICDVILGFVLLDRRDAPAFAEVCDGLVKILIEFFSENPFEFPAVIAGTGFEIFVAVEDIEDLELHAGEATGHEELYALINYIVES